MFDLNEAIVAYQTVIDEDYRKEVMSEEDNDLYAGIENLSEEDLSLLAEEVVEDLFNVGFEPEEIEESFIESLNESLEYNGEILNEFYGIKKAIKAAKKEYNKAKSNTRDPGSVYARLATQRASRRNRSVQRLKDKVKGAVKNASDSVRGAVKGARDSARGTVSGLKKSSDNFQSKMRDAGREAKFKAVDKHVASYANRRGLHPSPGLAARSKDPEKRRALRGKVVSDIKDRIISKARSVGRGVRDAARGAVSKVKSSSDAVQSKLRSGARSAVGKAARKVSDASGKVAKRLGEDVDIYDVVTDFLISEGYAEDEDHASYIMVNELTDDNIAAILDEGALELAQKYQKKMSKRKPGSKKYKKAEEKMKRHAYDAGREYALNNSYDMVADFLMTEGYAETIDDVNHIIINELTDKDIKAILDEARNYDFPPENRLQRSLERSASRMNSKYDPDAEGVPLHKTDREGYGERKNTRSDWKRRQQRKSGR